MSNVKFIITASLCFILSFAVAQEKMNKIIIENNHFHMVWVDTIYKRNGIILKHHLDSLLTQSELYSNSGYAFVPTRSRYNQNRINFDIKNNNFYSMTSEYFINNFNTGIVKIPMNEIGFLNDSISKKYVRDLRVLSYNRKHLLEVDQKPIKSHSFNKFPKDSMQTIYFDIVCLDDRDLRFFIYHDDSKKIEHWELCGNIFRKKEKKRNLKKPGWRLKASYDLDKNIYSPFTAFTINEKLYIITEDKSIYLITDKKLLNIGELPGRISDGYLVVDKDKNRILYIDKNQFKIAANSMNELLESAVTLNLERK